MNPLGGGRLGEPAQWSDSGADPMVDLRAAGATVARRARAPVEVIVMTPAQARGYRRIRARMRLGSGVSEGRVAREMGLSIAELRALLREAP